MAKKKEETEEVTEQEQVKASIDPATIKANQILEHMTSDMMFEGVQLDLNNQYHRVVAAWLIGRGGWLRK
jgi:hypothetical protein